MMHTSNRSGVSLGQHGAGLARRLDRVRARDARPPRRAQLAASAGLLASGVLLGLLQKWLDGLASNELPLLLQRLDITNYFGRLAIWVMLATAISVYASSPERAAINTPLFFIGMVSAYYLYSCYVLGFLPRSYMLVWIALAVLSPLPAYACWYAKGTGPLSIIISAGILGVLFSQAFLLMGGLRVTHLLEVITWACAVMLLRREPGELALELGLSLVFASLYQLFIPYWG